MRTETARAGSARHVVASAVAVEGADVDDAAVLAAVKAAIARAAERPSAPKVAAGQMIRRPGGQRPTTEAATNTALTSAVTSAVTSAAAKAVARVVASPRVAICRLAALIRNLVKLLPSASIARRSRPSSEHHLRRLSM